MSYGDATQESADESGETGERRDHESDGGRASRLLGYVRGGVRSGALAGIGGGATILRGIRAIRAGNTARGFRHLLVGGWLLAVAAVQRQSTRDAGKRIDIDQSDVVDTSPDLESAAGESRSQLDHASGAEASKSAAETDESPEEWAEEIESEAEEEPTAESETVEQSETDDQSPAAEETDESAEEWAEEVGSEAADGAETAGETDEAAGERAPIADDRLGAAAFDEHSNEVPAPQRAFNQEFLSMNAEVVWGIRDDHAIVVSQLFDPIQDGEDVQYVASTQITEDRIVTIPDEILDHWESVYDGIGVAGGDDIVFATGDELQDDEQLLVVPAAWADGLVSEDA